MQITWLAHHTIMVRHNFKGLSDAVTYAGGLDGGWEGRGVGVGEHQPSVAKGSSTWRGVPSSLRR